MSIASVDESAEDDPKTGEAPSSVEAYEAVYVVIAQVYAVLSNTCTRKEVGRAYSEEEVKVDKGADHVEYKMNSQEFVDESDDSALLMKSPGYVCLK